VGTLLKSKGFHYLYTSPSTDDVIKSRRMRWEGDVARTREMRNSYNILVRKPEGKKSQGRPTRRLDNNVRLDVREVGWKLWTGWILFRLETSGGLLCTR
jgi:hypothetical protein